MRETASGVETRALLTHGWGTRPPPFEVQWCFTFTRMGAAMVKDGEIITVRPSVPIDTLQKLPNYVGISRDTAGAQGISMNVVIIPAGAKAKPHYHEGFETAIYILKGEVQTFYGEGLAKSCINKQGDFLYIPAGLPHQPVNLSADTDAIALVSRTDASEQESVRAYEP
ncbi:MAG: cupin domain-containing protein [Limnobacter sp.]|uniref:cupin domain-containing protein n=1 Tax=Limnobacter sp. TaxID=2003368 RepID=UPI0039194D6E